MNHLRQFAEVICYLEFSKIKKCVAFNLTSFGTLK